MSELHDALSALGAGISYNEEGGQLPVTVSGPIREGGRVRLRGDVSSQFITALMLIGPMLHNGLRIELTSPLVSLPYVHLTASVMAAFGAEVDVAEQQIVVPAGRYEAMTFDVEPDASSASYPLAIAAIRGGSVTVAALTTASVQGDIAILDLLATMGCDVTSREGSVTVVRNEAEPLSGIDIEMSATSDLVPTIAAIAVTASTPTTIRGVGFIRAKESDRLGDLARELGADRGAYRGDH